MTTVGPASRTRPFSAPAAQRLDHGIGALLPRDHGGWAQRVGRHESGGHWRHAPSRGRDPRPGRRAAQPSEVAPARRLDRPHSLRSPSSGSGGWQWCATALCSALSN